MTIIKLVRVDSEIVPSLEYEGMTITNPYMDETGRFEVDPKIYYGLTEDELKVFKTK